MHVARWGNSLAIRLPAATVEALELREGDDVEIRIAGQRTFDIERDKGREQALERIRALRKPIPPGWNSSIPMSWFTPSPMIRERRSQKVSWRAGATSAFRF